MKAYPDSPQRSADRRARANWFAGKHRVSSDAVTDDEQGKVSQQRQSPNLIEQCNCSKTMSTTETEVKSTCVKPNTRSWRVFSPSPEFEMPPDHIVLQLEREDGETVVTGISETMLNRWRSFLPPSTPTAAAMEVARVIHKLTKLPPDENEIKAIARTIDAKFKAKE
jgi:hypothetical protein